MNDKIKKFFAISGVGVYFQRLLETLQRQVRAQFPEDVTDEDLPPQVIAMTTLLRDASEAKKFELVDDATKIYADTYSEEEIDALISFFESPTGKKVVAQGGVFLSAVAEAGNTWSEKIVNSLKDDFEKILNEQAVVEAPSEDAQLPLPIEQVTASIDSTTAPSAE